MIITAQMKDKVLNALINIGKTKFGIDLAAFANDLQIPLDFMILIIDQFQELGLLEKEGMSGYSAYLFLIS